MKRLAIFINILLLIMNIIFAVINVMVGNSVAAVISGFAAGVNFMTIIDLSTS